MVSAGLEDPKAIEIRYISKNFLPHGQTSS